MKAGGSNPGFFPAVACRASKHQDGATAAGPRFSRPWPHPTTTGRESRMAVFGKFFRAGEVVLARRPQWGWTFVISCNLARPSPALPRNAVPHFLLSVLMRKKGGGDRGQGRDHPAPLTGV
jgi:hypothetical protein